MEEKKSTKIKWLDGMFVFILTCLPLFLIWHFNAKIVFFNNDDLYIGELVSGITTGRPESHLVHIGYLTGWILSRLYMLVPSTPWYGIFLFTMIYGSIVTAFSAMIIKLEKVWQKILMTVSALYMICSFFFYHMAEIQYTTVTTVVCMTAVVLFVLTEDATDWKKYIKANILGFVFFFMSFNIRDKACVMVLPVFFFIGLGKVIKDKKLFRPVLAYASVLVVIMLLLFGVERIAYSGAEWKEFERYNTAREQVMDYAGFPNYEENIALYEELGISEQSYVSLATRYQVLLDEKVNADFMEAMEEVSSSDRKIDLIQMLKTFVERHLTSYMDRPLNIIVYFMYVAAIVLALVSGKYKALYDVLALFLGRMSIWAYLMYIGRSLPRVTQGIYIVELMVLFAIIISNSLWINKTKQGVKLPKIAGVCVIVGMIAICHRWGLPYSSNIYHYNNSQMAYATCYREMREYFNEHSENVYLADMFSFSYFTKDILAEEYPSVGNYVMMGNWVANSPWTDSIAERYQIESYEEAAIMQDNVYFVFIDSEGTSWQYLADYYAEKYPGSVMEVEEVVETTFGQDFLIVKVREG